MSNTVNINIAASDNGSIDKVTAKTKNLNKELTKAQTTAGTLGKPASGTVAYNKAKTQTDEMFEYRQARGGRGTGAEGRDFAKQSQGLGGLVHVYATFAANIFALTAAFGALSKAADYSNMVKGLDQLGAASGRNLGAISKNLISVTDGAISLKEAMAATAQGSAAGLTGDQLERMAKVAKTASLALGRDMADSMSRLSRGISKIEPELIDELGIFVKIDKAAQDYARTLGKTSSSLTDFERRQAYANAVLEEGEKKFSAIKLDANPYSKLEASFINIMYLGGELLNTVLGPVAKILSSSPAALGSAILAFATMLLSKAIPALRGWRENIREAAKEAKALAESKVEAAKLANIERLDKIKYAAEGKAEVQQEALGYAEENLKKRSEAAGKKIAKSVQSILAKDVRLIDDKDLAVIDKMAAKTTKLSGSYKEIAISIREAKDAELAYSDQVRRNQELLSKKPRATSVEGMNLREAQVLQRKSMGMDLVSSSVEKFSSLGWTAGWQEFNKKMSESSKEMEKLGQRFGILDQGMLRLKTGFGMGVVYVSKFINAFGFIGAAVAAAVGTFQLLDSWLSDNSKQLEEFKAAAETVKSSLTGLSATLDLIRNKDPFERLSVASIQAQANAIDELSNSISKMAKTLEEADKYASWWDKHIDGWKKLVGADIRSIATNNIVIGIEETLNASLDSAAKSKFTEKLAEILSTDNLTKGGMLEAAGKVSTDKIAGTLKALASAQKDFNNSNKATANSLSAYNESIEATQKSMQNLANSFTPSDAMSKFGSDQMQQAARLADALKDPEKALVALSDAATDFNILKLFPPEATKAILAQKDVLVQLRESVGAYDAAILATQKRLSEVAAGPGKLIQGDSGLAERTSGKETQQYKDIKAQEVFLKNLRAEDLKRVEALQGELQGVAMQMYDAGAKRVGQSLQTAMALGAIEAKKTLAGAVGGVEGVKIQEKLSRDAIGIQLKVIDSQMALILETKKLTIEMEEANAWAALDKGADPTNIYETLTKLGNQKKALEGSPSQVLKNIRGGSDDVKLGLSSTADQIVSSLEKKAGLSSQIQQSKYREDLAVIEDQFKKIQEKKEVELESLKIQEDSLALSYTSAGIYSDELENLVKSNKLDIQKAQLAKESAGFMAEEAKLNYIINKLGEGSYEGKLAKQRLDYISLQNAEKLANIESKSAQENLKAAREASSRRNASIAEDIDLAIKYQDIMTSALDDTEDALGRRDFTMRKVLDTTKLQLQQEKELLELRSKRNLETNQKAKDLLDEKILKQTKYNETQLEMVNLQIEYQEALVKTEQTLRTIEKSLTLTQYSGTEYMSAMYQDFSNKIADLTKNAKSAADAFNSSFIGAIDSSIDKFYDLLKEGKLTFKDMAKQLQDSIGDAFYDMAKQSIKNAWKDLLQKSGILKPSDTETVAKKMVDLNSTIAKEFPNLAKSIDNLANKVGGIGTPAKGSFDSSKTETFGFGTFGTGDAGNAYAKSQGFKPLDHKAANDGFYDDYTTKAGASATSMQTAAETSKLVADKNADTANLMSAGWKGLGGVLSLMPGAIGKFGSLIAMFGSYVMSRATSSATSSVAGAIGGGGGGGGGWMSSLAGIFSGGGRASVASGAGAIGGGGGGGGGWMSSLAGIFSGGGRASVASGAADYFSRAMMAAAQGAVVSGSQGLSQYSNSIVSSPTLFAFAKGGTPNVGLMGEAGTEAIIPLKRDAQGNLGVRSDSGQPKNIITINVSAPGGDPAEVKRSTAAASRTLLATLNGSRRYG